MSLYLPPLVMLAVLGNGEEIGLGIDVRIWGACSYIVRVRMMNVVVVKGSQRRRKSERGRRMNRSRE